MSEVVEIHYDPFNKFDGVYEFKILVYLCHVIHHWAYLAATKDIPIREVIHEHYGYPLDPFAGGKGNITEEGVHEYPEDPDLYPIGVITTARETIYCYEHEIIAIRNKDDKKVLILRVD